VKEYFKDVDPGKSSAFDNLLVLLVAQKRAGVGLPCVISQVKELFRGKAFSIQWTHLQLPNHVS